MGDLQTYIIYDIVEEDTYWEAHDGGAPKASLIDPPRVASALQKNPLVAIYSVTFDVAKIKREKEKRGDTFLDSSWNPRTPSKRACCPAIVQDQNSDGPIDARKSGFWSFRMRDENKRCHDILGYASASGRFLWSLLRCRFWGSSLYTKGFIYTRGFEIKQLEFFESLVHVSRRNNSSFLFKKKKTQICKRKKSDKWNSQTWKEQSMFLSFAA